MTSWFDENSNALFPGVVIAALVLLLASVVFLVLWLVSLYRRREENLDREDAAQDRRDLELALAEQTARISMIRELGQTAVRSIAVMVSQAEGVRYTGEVDPGAATRLAAVIEDAARSTQADLRRVMTIAGDANPEPGSTAHLDELPEVIGAMRSAGLTIEFEEIGERFDLVNGAELAVMRILQQALANSLKHGGESTDVRVVLSWSEDGLRLLVDDDGARARERSAGLDPNRISRGRAHNPDADLSAFTEQVSGAVISEMRERATLFGGVFNAYPVPGVGFSIAVAFPALRYDNGVHGVNLTS